ncbi:MAG TPA: cytochrome c peroxidase [Cyclobacteriaceae bacterium]|nr:cytochrome c peroxidase [Cyclobacteriaceae bacterium]
MLVPFLSLITFVLIEDVMKLKAIWTIAAGVMVFILACEPFENGSRELVLDLPAVPASYNVPGVTDDLPTLGRVLFYDTRLSLNNSISCASCHKQTLAFSDNAALSRGFENRITSRNSMAIQNIISDAFQEFIIPADTTGNTDSTTIVVIDPGVIGYMPGVPVSPDFVATPTSLFWDGRESNLKQMVTRPIMNHIEMGIHDMDALAQKLNQIPEYESLFQKAFGEQEVTAEKISQGLSAFLLSIRSNQSKFDKAMVFRTDAFTFNSKPANTLTINLPLVNLSAQEELGRQLFFNKFNCNNCHDANGFADIGLDASPKDAGLMETTGVLQHKGQFKIPSLRNVELTGPYMHDGRFKTLEAVIEHYSHGINNSPNLDTRLKGLDGRPLQMNMTPGEVKAIAAFLSTLTDYQLISDTRFSNPFKVKQ